MKKARAYRRPGQEVDLQVWVNALDVVEDREDVRRGLVDVELAEGSVTRDIVVAVDYSTNKLPCPQSKTHSIIPEAEKSEAPRGTRMYERPAPPFPSVAIVTRDKIRPNTQIRRRARTIKEVSKDGPVSRCVRGLGATSIKDAA